jgi:hypothetical protein
VRETKEETKKIMKNNYPSIQKTAWSLKSEREQTAEFNAEMARIEKQTFALKIFLAFLVGASVALAFVISHQMIITEWTW